METFEINRAAVGGSAKAVRLALKQQGMRRCSLQLVYRQCKAALHLDWYGVFLRWFTALWLANREGAEFLLSDFLARVARLRESDAPACWREQMAACQTEHSDVVCAALVNDLARMRRETVEAIAAKQRLVVTLDRLLDERRETRAA